jgi:hypothetical protein
LTLVVVHPGGGIGGVCDLWGGIVVIQWQGFEVLHVFLQWAVVINGKVSFF